MSKKGPWNKEKAELLDYHLSVYSPISFRVHQEIQDGYRMVCIDKDSVVYPYRKRRMDIKWLGAYLGNEREWYWNIKWVKPEEK